MSRDEKSLTLAVTLCNAQSVAMVDHQQVLKFPKLCVRTAFVILVAIPSLSGSHHSRGSCIC